MLAIYLHTTDWQTVNYNSTNHAVQLIYFHLNKQKMSKTHLKSLASSNHHCTEENPPQVWLLHKCLHVFVTSFKCRKDVTLSNPITTVIFQWQLTSAGAHFQNCDFVVSYNMIFNIGYLGQCLRIQDALLNYLWKIVAPQLVKHLLKWLPCYIIFKGEPDSWYVFSHVLLLQGDIEDLLL